MSAVHSRMPAILEPDDWDAWLSAGDDDPGWQAALLRPAPEDVLRRHPVSRDVNAVANSGPELIQPIAAPESQDIARPGHAADPLRRIEETVD